MCGVRGGERELRISVEHSASCALSRSGLMVGIVAGRTRVDGQLLFGKGRIDDVYFRANALFWEMSAEFGVNLASLLQEIFAAQ